MVSVQERLQLKRLPLDKWSIREQLCLASAVSCSGDQNWMSVSRSLKMLCGANRPNDWFSQKSCAVQYGELLENVETPKRKKRTTSERDTQIAETPTESILRKLTHEHISELKCVLQKEKDEYTKLHEEILSIQNGNIEESKLNEMWSQIEQEQEQKLLEQQKQAQLLKEREERKNEVQQQRQFRPGTYQQSPTTQSPQTKPSQLNLNLKSDEMEVDETNPKQGTSPLLTSLLKSPSPAPTTVPTTVQPTTSSVRVTAPTITNLLTGNTKPLITASTSSAPQQFHVIQHKPLTGPIPTESLPQVIQSPSQEAPTLSMLLENKSPTKDATPSTSTTTTTTTTTTETQSNDLKPEESIPDPMETEDDAGSPNKDEDQQLMEVFNGLIPDNIEELADILTNNNAIILNPELLEEESILENVESLIDEEEQENVDKDKKDKKDVPETKQIENQNSKNMEENFDSIKIIDEIKENSTNALDPKVIPKRDNISDGGGGGGGDDDNRIDDNSRSSESKSNDIIEIDKKSSPITVKSDKDEEIEKSNEIKSQNKESIETSDDSTDNTCLQSLKKQIQESNNSVEIKMEQIKEEEEEEEDEQLEEDDDIKLEEKPKIIEIIKEEGLKDEKIIPKIEEQKKEICIEAKSNFTTKEPSEMDTSEVIIIPEDDEIIDDDDDEKLKDPENKKPNLYTENVKTPPDLEIETIESTQTTKVTQSIDEIATNEIKDLKIDIEQNSPDNTITIIDTDDDSPIEVIKEDKSGKTKRDYSRKKIDSTTQQLLDNSNKKSDDTTVENENRLNLSIRKLKERERSESPLIDDDGNDIIPRTRRRYSSTPIIDSIPNSPASSDDREYKVWKKSILIIYNKLLTHKCATLFLRPITDEMAPNYKTIILRPMDLPTIKRNIESGAIRTTSEFHRDILLMCYNAIIFNKKDNNVISIAKEMITDSTALIESFNETTKKDMEKSSSGGGGSSSGIKSRRKIHRLP